MITQTSKLIDKINDAIASGAVKIPDDHRIAVVTSAKVVNGQLEANAAVAIKLGKGWHVGIMTDWSHDTGVSEGIHLTWSK